MTGDELPPAEGAEVLPLEPEATDPDALPLDEVEVIARPAGAEGAPYHYWRIPGVPESLVGYADPEVARKHGALELRKRRQLRAMRRP